MSCPVMSCLVLSCHDMSCHVMLCHVMSYHVMSFFFGSRSCHVMSCLFMSRHGMSCPVMSYHVLSCDEIETTHSLRPGWSPQFKHARFNEAGETPSCLFFVFLWFVFGCCTFITMYFSCHSWLCCYRPYIHIHIYIYIYICIYSYVYIPIYKHMAWIWP